MVAYQTVVLQSRFRIRRPPSPQLTANLLVGCHLEMALGCGLTSVRGNRGENYENEPLVRQKTYKERNFSYHVRWSLYVLSHTQTYTYKLDIQIYEEDNFGLSQS